jgi:hypothetical protein
LYSSKPLNRTTCFAALGCKTGLTEKSENKI